MAVGKEELMAIANQVKPYVLQEVKSSSEGVDDVEVVDDLTGLTSLPVYDNRGGQKKIVRASIALFGKPADDAAEKANTAAEKANAAADAANTAAGKVNDGILDLTQEKQKVLTAITNAESATSDTNTARENIKAEELIRVESEKNREAAELERKSEFTRLKSESETSTSKANTAAESANTAAANANDTANHPTIVGEDNYVYKWNNGTQSYDKTDVYVRGEGFKVSRVFTSVDEMNAYTGTGLKEGDFVLINTGSVDDEDTAKLYTYNPNATPKWTYLVDMSGAIGFTGKTPQFVVGNVLTGEPGTKVSIALEPRPDDAGGNPVYAMNISIPKGDKLVFSDLTAEDIALLQRPASDMIAKLEDTDTAVAQAEKLRVAAEGGRVSKEIERMENEQMRVTAENERQNNTATAITNAKAATDISVELNEHVPKPVDGYWYIWDLTTKKYINSGVQAKGDTGSSFRIIGRYGTLDELKTAIPDGTDVDGVFAVGVSIPYNYYAWAIVNGVWQWDDQGQLKGEQGEAFLYEDFTPDQIAELQRPASDMIAKLEDTDTAVAQAEKLRVAAESGRVSKEIERIENEKLRVAAESKRQENETERIEAEKTRVSQEQGRVTAESGRDTAEQNRLKQENGRVTAENERIENEKLRVVAENERQKNTSTAITNAKSAAARALLVSKNPPRIIDNLWAFYDIGGESYIVSEYPAVGLTPYIGENGHWWIGTVDTGVSAGFDDAPNDGQDYVRRSQKWEPVSVGDGGNQFTELDDMEIQAGSFTNAGAGWNSFTFPHEFPGIPSLVCSPVQDVTARNYFVNLKSVTSKGFLYQLGYAASSAYNSCADKVNIHYQAIYNDNI